MKKYFLQISYRWYTCAIAESYLRRSLEAIFDVGRHITSETVGKGIVEYKGIAILLDNT